MCNRQPFVENIRNLHKETSQITDSYFYLFSLVWHFTLHHKLKVDANEFINLIFMSLSAQFFDQSLSRCSKIVLFNKITGPIRCSQVPKMNTYWILFRKNGRFCQFFVALLENMTFSTNATIFSGNSCL